MAPALRGAHRILSLGIAALMLLTIEIFVLLTVLNIDISIGIFQQFFIAVMTVWIVTVGLYLWSDSLSSSSKYFE